MLVPSKPDFRGGGESHDIAVEKRLCIFCYKNVSTNSKNVQRVCEKFLMLLERFVGQWTKNPEPNICHITENLQFLDCCENCLGTVSSFCDEFDQLRCLELKLQWRVDTLMKIMKLANRVPSRMQQLRDCFKDHCRTEKDEETIEQRFERFIRFRHQMIKKCKRKLSKGQPRVLLKRLVDDPLTTVHNGNVNREITPPALEMFWGWIYSFTAVTLLASISFEHSECNDFRTTLCEMEQDPVIAASVVPECVEGEGHLEDHSDNIGDVDDADGTDRFDGVAIEIDDNCSEQNFVFTMPLPLKCDNVREDMSHPTNLKIESSFSCDPHLPSKEKEIEVSSGDYIRNEEGHSVPHLYYIATQQENSYIHNQPFEMENPVNQIGMTKKEGDIEPESPEPTPNISRAPHKRRKRKPQVKKRLKRKVLLLRRKTSNLTRKQQQLIKSKSPENNVEGLVQQSQSSNETNHVSTYPTNIEDGTNKEVEYGTDGEETPINIAAATSQNHPAENVESHPKRYSLRGNRKICYQTVDEEDEDDISNDHDDIFDEHNESDMDEVSSASSHSDYDSKIKVEEAGVSSKTCQICSKTFTRNFDLKRHLKRVACQRTQRKEKQRAPPRNQETQNELKLGLLSCPVVNCKDKFITKEELEGHKDVHGKFQCQACEVFKEYAPDLSIHETEHVTKVIKGCSAQWNCYRCTSTFITKPKYVNHHIKEHLGILNASFRRCTICGYEDMDRRLVQDHYDSNHYTNGLDPSQILKCDHEQCQAYFVKKGQLINHKLKSHYDGKCPECMKSFRDYRFLSRHIQTSHPESEYVQNYEFRCDMGNCRKTFANKIDLNHHKRKYRNNIVHQSPATTIHKCDQCERKFDNGDKLIMHKIRHHFKGKCDECGKTIKTTRNLAMHMKVKHQYCFTELNLFSCTFEGCNKTFCTRSLLSSHLTSCSYNFTERLKKRITCPKCDKAFKGECTLKLHMKTVHEAERSFICTECGKAFKTNSYLETHMVYHLGPDGWKFQCSTCGRKFADGYKLDQHMRTHSKEKPFICQLCGERYAHRHNWRNHMNTKHKDEYDEGEATKT